MRFVVTDGPTPISDINVIFRPGSSQVIFHILCVNTARTIGRLHRGLAAYGLAMKAIMRLLLLLLALTFPINGIAQLYMSTWPSMHHATLDGESECHGAQAQQDKPPVCKAEHQCNLASLLQVLAGKAQAIPLAKPIPIPYVRSLLARSPDSVWHPPRTQLI